MTVQVRNESSTATSSMDCGTIESEPFKLAPFNPSGLEIQEKSIHLLELTDEDVLFDIGCGDGRLLIAAAQRHPGLRCVGIELDPIFATRANQAIQQLPDYQEIKSRIDIRLGDALQVPMMVSTRSCTPFTCTELTLIDDATAIYLFIVPKGILKLLPLLESLVETRRKQHRPFRIVSYMFKIHCWEPTKMDKSSRAGCPIYLYDFPARV